MRKSIIIIILITIFLSVPLVYAKSVDKVAPKNDTYYEISK